MSDVTAGLTTISARALTAVVSAVSAEALGVDTRQVGVSLTDERGSLVLTVRTAIRVVALGRITADSGLVARAGGSILERAAAAQQDIRDRVNWMTGYAVERVVVHLTSVDIRQARRVR